MPNHHRHRQLKEPERHIKGRILLGLIGIGCILVPAIVVISIGRQYYPNTWGAPVFVPSAIIAGVLCVAFALRSPKNLR
jgi:hypothetical protein